MGDWAIAFLGDWLGDRVLWGGLGDRVVEVIGWAIVFCGEWLGDMRTKLNLSPFLSLSHKQDHEYRN